MRYLYGASVQGIQDFIFSSNRLQEIVGASNFVEEVCTSIFEHVLGSGGVKIIGAAGNVRYILTEAECKKVVRNFPFEVMRQAPGLTISQAVVEIKDEIFGKHFEQLDRLLDIQRNHRKAAFQTTWMAVERSRRSGEPAETIDVDKEGNSIYPSRQERLKKDYISKKRLIEALAGNKSISEKQFPNEIDQIAGGAEKKDSWVAVMHADGNGLGALIIKMMHDKTLSGDKLLETYRTFSQQLDEATRAAAKRAFKEAFKRETNESKNASYLIRPILLGGDDITVIMKADKALLFTNAFMKAFEEETKNHFQQIDWEPLKQGLTICAGIAYVKPGYPFHYAARLSDELCKQAKTVSKGSNDSKTPSSLLFHFVHSSFIGSYKETVTRELTTDAGRFDFGPYFIQPNQEYTSVEKLFKWIEKFKDDEAPTAQLRSLITEYTDGNKAAAKQYESRLRTFEHYQSYLSLAGMNDGIFTVEREQKETKTKQKFSPAADIIKMAQLHKTTDLV